MFGRSHKSYVSPSFKCARGEIQTAEYTLGERAALSSQIKSLLQEQNAVLVAHYYISPELQQLNGRFGNEHPATTLVVAGVRFMGETAKILNSEKRVLMPDGEVTCSLELMKTGE